MRRALVLTIALVTLGLHCAPPRAEIHPPAGCPCGAALCERAYTQCGLDQDGPDASPGSCGDRYVSCCFGGPGCVALGSGWMRDRRERGGTRAARSTPPPPSGGLRTVFAPDAGAR